MLISDKSTLGILMNLMKTEGYKAAATCDHMEGRSLIEKETFVVPWAVKLLCNSTMVSPGFTSWYRRPALRNCPGRASKRAAQQVLTARMRLNDLFPPLLALSPGNLTPSSVALGRPLPDRSPAPGARCDPN